MFEEQLEEEEREDKEERRKLLEITAAIVSILVVAGVIVYLTSRVRSKIAPSVLQPVAAGRPAPDPLHDLTIVRARMGKDVSGIRVKWSVKLQNKSSLYTYSDIQYEARFIGPDGRTRSANRDTIKDSVGPGEQKNIPEFVDGIYDSNASTYQFVLLSAKSTTQ